MLWIYWDMYWSIEILKHWCASNFDREETSSFEQARVWGLPTLAKIAKFYWLILLIVTEQLLVFLIFEGCVSWKYRWWSRAKGLHSQDVMGKNCTCFLTLTVIVFVKTSHWHVTLFFSKGKWISSRVRYTLNQLCMSTSGISS